MINKETLGLTFPRTDKPVISDTVRKLCGIVSFSPEDLDNDAYLKYLLER